MNGFGIHKVIRAHCKNYWWILYHNNYMNVINFLRLLNTKFLSFYPRSWYKVFKLNESRFFTDFLILFSINKIHIDNLWHITMQNIWRNVFIWYNWTLTIFNIIMHLMNLKFLYDQTSVIGRSTHCIVFQ